VIAPDCDVCAVGVCFLWSVFADDMGIHDVHSAVHWDVVVVVDRLECDHALDPFFGGVGRADTNALAQVAEFIGVGLIPDFFVRQCSNMVLVSVSRTTATMGGWLLMGCSSLLSISTSRAWRLAAVHVHVQAAMCSSWHGSLEAGFGGMQRDRAGPLSIARAVVVACLAFVACAMVVACSALLGVMAPMEVMQLAAPWRCCWAWCCCIRLVGWSCRSQAFPRKWVTLSRLVVEAMEDGSEGFDVCELHVVWCSWRVRYGCVYGVERVNDFVLHGDMQTQEAVVVEPDSIADDYGLQCLGEDVVALVM
jgi:hypothetical protein